jgi:hypothetical protein
MLNPIKKLRLKVLWILIPAVLALVVYTKWDTWFYNPPEPKYSSSKTPEDILLTWSGDPCTTREVTWQCDASSKSGKLQLLDLSAPGDTVNFPSKRFVIKSEGGAATYFQSEIKDLKPGQLYSYRAGSEGGWSEWHQFKTQCPGDHSFSFIFIGDIQDSINGTSGELYQKAVNRQPDAGFMIFIGDMIERTHDEYWKEWFRSGGELFKTIPIIATPGNHEYYKGLSQDIDPRWMAHFAFPQNGPASFKGRVCYWDYGNTRFISMDTNAINLYTGFIQRAWLKNILKQTTKRWKVVIMHHPAFTTSRTHDNFLVRWFFKGLFDKYKVDLVLQGHEHGYGRSAYITNSAFPSKQGPVYVISHDSPKLYDLNFSKDMDQLASNTRMYQLINISHDSLSYRAYTADGILYDDFALLKNQNGENKMADLIPSNVEERLLPTKDFIRRHSTEIAKYNREMIDWARIKKRLLP